MPFYRQEMELLLLLGSYEFQDIGRTLFWYEAQCLRIAETCKFAELCYKASVPRDLRDTGIHVDICAYVWR